MEPTGTEPPSGRGGYGTATAEEPIVMQSVTSETAERTPLAVWAVGGLWLALHLLPRPGYGFHRDELLYLAMADHLEPLRMQFPPLIAILGWFAKALPLGLLSAIHLLAALAGTGILVATVAITRRLGGSREAQILAALAMLASPFLMRAGALFQPVVFEHLWWVIGALSFVVLLDGGHLRWWVVFGVAAGLGGLTKLSAPFFGVAMAVGVLASPLRSHLRTPWPWLAVVAGALISSPSILGQLAWGWPFFEQARVLREGQLAQVTPAGFLTGQLLLAGAAAPLLLIGGAALFVSPPLRRFLPLGVTAGTALALFLVTGGKEYYFGPMHPPLIAAGSVAAGRWFASRPRAWRGAVAWSVVGAVVLLPMGVPLLPPYAMARYSAALGVTRAVTTNVGEVLPLPQDYADMLGWREQVEAVARVYYALPREERDQVLVVGGNYGRAGALALYHQEFGLPYPVSRHGDFYGWGPGEGAPTVVIIVGGTVSELSQFFGEVVEAGRVLLPMGVPEERDVAIHLCRFPTEPIRDLWKRLGPVWG
jgi:hypothetical protein